MKKLFLILTLLAFSILLQADEFQTINNNMKPLITETQIQQEIQKIAKQIDKQYQGKEIAILMVMKGSICFAADLIRELKTPTTLQFINCSSYGSLGKHNTALVTLGKKGVDATDKHVIIVDDILDSGQTMKYLYEFVDSLKPASLKTMVLLKKNRNDNVRHFEPDFALFEIKDRFVIGYGLDYKEYYRGLKSIYYIPDSIP